MKTCLRAFAAFCLAVLTASGGSGAFGSSETLHDAARTGDVGAVTRMLDAGAYPNPRGKHRATPLHLAAGYGHREVVRLLRERGS